MSSAHKIPLSVEQLLIKGREIAAVDIVDEDAIEPLTVLVGSLNEDAELHELGALRMQDKLTRILANRLRMLRDFAAHPEIHEQKITAPIFVAGSVRTGSTKIQRLFTASDDFNWLPLWKTLNSASYTGRPGEDVTPRVADADGYIRDFYAGSPEAAATHEQGTHIAEEESYIFIQNLRCPGYMGYANVSSYLQWLARQDMVKTYEYLRDTLKYLQWQGLADPAKRWFLKCPFHCGMEATLTKVFPDASMIFTHRPPTEIMPSMFSMLSTYMTSHSCNTKVDAHALTAGFAYSLENHIAFRSAHPEFPVFDIDYREATTDAEAVIRRVYQFLNIPLANDALQRMCDWDANHPIHKHGAHKYSLEDFDLTKSEINTQCPNYLDFYKQRFSHLDHREGFGLS